MPTPVTIRAAASALALCLCIFWTPPASALQPDAGVATRDIAGQVHELVTIDGTGERVHLDFDAPLENIVAALLRTSSYEWPYAEFESLIRRHGFAALRAAVAERMRAMPNRDVVEAHRKAATDSLSPLSELSLPAEAWAAGR